MALNVSVSEKARNVLDSIVNRNRHTREAIMQDLNVSMPSVNGALVGLRRNGLIEIDDRSGDIRATGDGIEYVKPAARGGRAAPTARPQAPQQTTQGAAPRAGSKMEQATKIFEEMMNRPRKEVLAEFRKIGLTDKGASTYYQTLRARHGLTLGVAAQKQRQDQGNGGNGRR